MLGEMLTPITGFISIHDAPITRLSKEFEPWETLLLAECKSTSEFRQSVRELNVLDPSVLTNERELERCHLVLCLLSHWYIQGKQPKVDTIDPILPKSLAIPWHKVSKILGLQPVVCYQSIELANWKITDPSKPLHLDNLEMLHTFSGTQDEAWFYLVPLGIEVVGANALCSLIKIQQLIDMNTTESILHHLILVKNTIEEMTAILKRMYEKNDPKVFWNQVRPFSGGSKNAANLPNGLFYEGVLETDEYVHDAPLPIGPQGNVLNGTWRKYAGASAGQSPLIHSLDILLGIHHKDLVDSEKVNPMMEMRNYLSRVHKDFLKNLEKTPSLRELILKHHHLEWSSAFNDILNAFKGFRDAHIQLTSVYIISQALKEKNELKEESVVQETKAAVDLDLKGTGGTSLVKFLKQTRQETLDAMIEH